MRIKIGSEYSPRVSVYLDTVKHEDKGEVAGMLRGLMCSIDGWGAISGLTNENLLKANRSFLIFLLSRMLITSNLVLSITFQTKF
jgi:hypothetical protein